MTKINILVFGQARGGTGFMKSLINQNSNLNMHNINTSFLQRGITLQDWFSLKNTDNFVIFPDILTILSKNLILGAEKYVYYIRKDLVAHSVSRVIAGIIGYRKNEEIPEPKKIENLEKLKENPLTLEKIHSTYSKLLCGHIFYQQFIEHHRLNPYILYYGDLDTSPKQKTSETLKYFGVNVSASEIKPPNIQRQTTSYNQKLINMYKNSKYYQQNRGHDILDPKYQLIY